jgi:signal transduction histidine kinase
MPAAGEVARALAASVALFAAVAAAIPVRAHTVLIVLWGLIFLAAVIAGARRLGPLYGVPLAITAGIAFDSFYIPPTRPLGIGTWQNDLVVGIYIALGVLVGTLAEASRRRAQASERERALLADEQVALRRVATLVARGVAPQEVFAAAAAEVRELLGGDSTRLVRYEPDATATIIAVAGGPDAVAGGLDAAGTRWTLEPPMALEAVLRTGAAARLDGYDGVSDQTREDLRRSRIRSSVASPVVVAGRLWGAMVLSSATAPLPPGTERRMVDFTELLGIAIGNADARDQLTTSRVRIVAAADDARRRIERDLHDGVQQRLVSLALDVRRASRRAPELQASLAGVVEHVNDITEQLRQISRGIHPAILSQGGLAPALRTLARRCAVPVTVTIDEERRLPDHVEVAAYYVVAEALTNVVKHANATRVSVDVHTGHDTLRLLIRDDGDGRADPARGSGLVGLVDRVEALGGAFGVESPAGQGTTLDVTLPVAG